jgi:hypothetical protein
MPTLCFMTAFQRLDYKKLISEPSVSCVSVRIMEVPAFWCVRLKEIKENPLYTLEEDQNLFLVIESLKSSHEA